MQGGVGWGEVLHRLFPRFRQSEIKTTPRFLPRLPLPQKERSSSSLAPNGTGLRAVGQWGIQSFYLYFLLLLWVSGTSRKGNSGKLSVSQI